ncbi:MAG TPA: cyclic nucleotide-binding domain-containing protein [Candidatus Acidoferrum sp.]|nr:cyclic nucleotide-binding domain-containing protein [Candidatus Acidoferrum sp.]
MSAELVTVGFKIWGVDNVVYGPVELPLLVDWVKDKRITADTWIYCETDDAWRKAAQVDELRMFFGTRAAAAARTLGDAGITAGILRRVKAFGALSDDQLARFVEFMEIRQVEPHTHVVRQHEQGDAMYLVLEGELRVRMLIEGKESTLQTLEPGDCFGEIALFDQGPRSADVVANADSTLLKISQPAFQRLLEQAPDIAAPFLMSISKTLTARIRADNKRFRDTISLARATP